MIVAVGAAIVLAERRPSAQTTIVVTTTAQTPAAASDCTLSQAIEAAGQGTPVGGCATGSTISLPAGTYVLSSVGYGLGGYGPDALPQVISTLEIDGAGADRTIVALDPTAPGMRLLEVDGGGGLVLRGLTLRGGRSPRQGGAILNTTNTSVTVDHVVFDRNSGANNGGAVAGVGGGSFSATATTFSNNTTPAGGGAYGSCTDGATISGSTFTGNTAETGGGAIYVFSCFGLKPGLSISDTIFLDNRAGLDSGGTGGAVEYTGGSSLTVARARFAGNAAGGNGGAIVGASGAITDSTFSGNEGLAGGAIYDGGTTLDVRGSTFDGNTTRASDGGAIVFTGGGTLANVTITGNYAAAQGGGVSYKGASPLTLSNVTLANNTAERGGGLWFWYAGTDVRLRNSIVAGNVTVSGAAPDMGSDTKPIDSDGYNLIGNSQDAPYASAGSDQVGTAAAPIDPRLGPLAPNGGSTSTRALLAGSPALDAGNPAAPGSTSLACETTDQRGHTRPGAGTSLAVCDIGAYERDLSTSADLAAGKSASAIVTYAGQTVTYTIAVVNNGLGIATGVVVTDQLPPQLTPSTATATPGSCTIAGQTVTCTIDPLVTDQSATVSVIATAQAAGAWSNSAVVTSDAGMGAPAGGITTTTQVSVHQPIVVNTTLQTSSSPTDCTLSGAIQASSTHAAVGGCPAGTGNDLILVPAGTYVFTSSGYSGGYGPDALPLATAQMEIRGAGSDQTLVMLDPSAPQMRWLEYGGGAGLTVDGLTLRGWRSPRLGSAILNTTDSPVVVDHVLFDGNSTGENGGAVAGVGSGPFSATASTFSNNSAANLGGAYSTCTARLTSIGGSTFAGNSANAGGGAIYVGVCFGAAPVVDVVDSTFQNNTTGLTTGGTGGAIQYAASQLSITRGRFLSNSAGGNGGAIVGAAGTVTDSTFSGNQGSSGGAIYDGGMSLVIRGSTFDTNTATAGAGGAVVYSGGGTIANTTLGGNTAAGQGGGIYYKGTAALALSNVTVAGNTSQQQGGGLWFSYAGTDLRLRNTIVAGNTANSGTGPDLGSDTKPINSDGYNLIGNGENALYAAAAGDQVGTAAAPIDPKLGPLAANGGPTQTRALLGGSPALDAGNPSTPGSTPLACEPTDQRGITRPQHTYCDIGAFELQASAPVLTLPSTMTVVATSAAGAAVDYGTVTATDSIDGTLTATCTPASGSTFAIGTTAVTCTATNSGGVSASGVFSIVVTDAPPVITNPGSEVNRVGDIVALSIKASDPDGATLMYSASGLPPGLGISVVTGTIGGTPTFAGTFTSTVTANDGHGNAASTTFSWTVKPVNHPPVVTNPGNQANYTGTSVSLPIVATDPDGDPLTFSAANLPGGLSMDPATGVIHGTITEPAHSSSVSFTTTVTVADPFVAVSVTFDWDVLHAPTIIQPRDQVNTRGDAVSLQIVHGTGTQAGIVEPGLFSATGLPAGLTISPDGLISGTVAARAVGAWDPTVTFTGVLGTAVQTRFHWVVIDNPQITDLEVEWLRFTPEESINGQIGTFATLQITNWGHVQVPGVTLSTTVPFGPSTSWTCTHGPSGQQLAMSEIAPGVFALNQGMARDGGDSIECVALVGAPPTAANEVSLAVNVEPPAGWTDPYQWNNNVRWSDAADRPALGNPGNQQNAEGTRVRLPIRSTDPTSFGVFQAVGLPPGLRINPDTGVISGWLSYAVAGTYRVAIELVPGDFSSVTPLAQVTFTWTITNVSRPPVVFAIANQLDRINVPLTLPVMAFSRDGLPLTYTASGLPTGLTIDPASGSISGAPSAAGNFGVTITVFDGHSAARTSFAWRIVNDAGPILINPGDQRNYCGDVVHLQIVAKDNDRDRLRYAATGLPSGLQIDSATGLISGTISQLNARDSDARSAVTVTVSDRYFAASVTFDWDVLHAPTIVQPRDQVNASGDLVALQIVHGTGTQAGVVEPGVFSATGLPPGLTISGDGLISGTVTDLAIGAWDPTITFAGVLGTAVQTRFHWVIGSGPITDLDVHWSSFVLVDGQRGQTQMFATVQITNWGHRLIPGVTLSTTVPFGSTFSGWSCTYEPGGSPAASVSGPGVVVFGDGLAPEGRATIDCQTIIATPTTPATELSLAVSVEPPPGWTDPYQWNNGARWSDASDHATLVNPGDQVSGEGSTLLLPVVAQDPNSYGVFNAVGLPPGLGINPDTGVISGELSYASAGTYTVTIELLRPDQPSNSQPLASVTFTWVVTPPI